MSRIRSVHPGFFRDEDLVSCSAFARLLFIGIGVEADDKGIFEWKPVQLKMCIFPADGVDVAELLTELVAAGNVMRFEVGGRAYGAIRNFRKYQRPKTPNNVHPMPDAIAQYVAFPQKEEKLDDDGPPFPPDGEKSPQMEDGGGRVEEEDKSSAPVPVAVAQQGARVEFEDVWEAFPRNPSSSRDIAKAEWERTKPADRPDILKASIRRAQWFGQDCETRGRTVEEGERYEPHLAKWLKGGWRDSLTLPVKGEADPSLAVVRPGTDDFAALERHRGGKITLYGESLTVTKAELEQALLQESVH